MIKELDLQRFRSDTGTRIILKFTDPEIKLTLVNVAKNCSRNRITRAFYSETESKSQPGYFPGTGVASELISVNHRYGAGTKV